tara:strand:+ start:971 stop:2695 length:1725 start_codon:yes stop_codon:yes gene_type:complete
MNETVSSKSQEFDRLLAKSIDKSNLKEGSIVQGIISEIEDEAVIVDIGAKVEGRIPKREFAFQKDQKELGVGDKLDVYLESLEDHQGSCRLSRAKARSKEIWKNIEKSFEAGELVQGIIVQKCKGGLSVDINIPAFLPGSQISNRGPIKDISHLLNTPMMFKILKMDSKRSNVVVSRRAVLEESHKEERKEKFEQFKLDSVVEGRIKALTDYGAFVDLDGYDSLLHSSDITHGRISHPSEVLKIDQMVKVKVIKVDKEKNRISVGLKQLQESPWDNVHDKIKVGDKVKGTCTNIQSYGVFIEISAGLEGLAHRDELTWSEKLNSKPANLFSRTQSVDCVVLSIDTEMKRLSLSIKRCTENPWIKFNEEYPVGSILDTEITDIRDNIIFCSLAEGIDGALFSNSLSWDDVDLKAEIKKYKVGDKIKVKIIANENEKVTLSIREVEGNPFDEIKDKNKGDALTCKILEVGEDFGIKVQVGTKGPITTIRRNELALKKEDCRVNRFGKGDRVDAEIVSLDKNEYKISLSIKALESRIETEALSLYGKDSANSGAKLSDILGAALRKGKKDTSTDKEE